MNPLSEIMDGYGQSMNDFRQESAKPVRDQGSLEESISNPLHVVVFSTKVVIIATDGDVIVVKRQS